MPRLSTAEWAKFWRVPQRTVQRWIKVHEAGEMPSPDDVPGMLAWALTARNLSDAFLARCAELRAGANATPPTGGGAAETEKNERAAVVLDWKTFKAKLEAGGLRDHNAQLTDLSGYLEFFKAKLEEAFGINDQAGVKFWNEQVLDTSNTIRQQKLAADKLGLEEGELFSKDQLNKLLRAWCFWAMRSIDNDLPELRKRVLGLTDERQAQDVLEPFLLANRFLKPFAKAARIESDSTLAPWIYETMKDAVDDYIEDGAKEFGELSAP